jgi:hypothetical protein
VSPARVVEAPVASDAAVVSRLFEVVFTPPTAVLCYTSAPCRTSGAPGRIPKIDHLA